MTKREFLQAVINSEGVAVNVKEFAEAEIEKLNVRNANRSSKSTKMQIENESIKAKILKVLTNEPMIASVIGEKVGISTQKASALCRQIAESGTIQVQEVKVSKKGKQKGYFLITDIEESEETE